MEQVSGVLECAPGYLEWLRMQPSLAFIHQPLAGRIVYSVNDIQ